MPGMLAAVAHLNRGHRRGCGRGSTVQPGQGQGAATEKTLVADPGIADLAFRSFASFWNRIVLINAIVLTSRRCRHRDGKAVGSRRGDSHIFNFCLMGTMVVQAGQVGQPIPEEGTAG